MNYKPIFGNLQGGRLGLFTFTVVALEVPGSIPESGSSTSLYDLWLRIEEPAAGGVPFHVTIRDHEPDSIQTERARYEGGNLTVWGKSNFGPTAYMTVSVDGPDAGTDPAVNPSLLEVPVPYSGGRYRLLYPSAENLDGRRLTIQTDKGGAYVVVIE
jgi:hypothetical protein